MALPAWLLHLLRKLPALLGTFMGLDCLSYAVQMDGTTKLPEGATLWDVQHGNVACAQDATPNPTAFGLAVALVLLLEHGTLLAAPILLMVVLRRRQLMAALQSPALLSLGLCAFAVSSLGEVGLHTSQRWLYFNLLPSVYQAFFYGGLTLGFGLQAAAFSNMPERMFIVKITVMAVAVVCALIVWGSWHLAQAGLPRDRSIVAQYIVVWVCTFIALTCSTVGFMCKAKNPGPTVLWRIGYSVVMGAFYAVGIFVATLLARGVQGWHVLVALSFMCAFAVQSLWLFKALQRSLHDRRHAHAE